MYDLSSQHSTHFLLLSIPLARVYYKYFSDDEIIWLSWLRSMFLLWQKVLEKPSMSIFLFLEDSNERRWPLLWRFGWPLWHWAHTSHRSYSRVRGPTNPIKPKNMFEIHARESLRVTGQIATHKVLILMGNGSTHNFIQKKVALKLDLSTNPTQAL